MYRCLYRWMYHQRIRAEANAPLADASAGFLDCEHARGRTGEYIHPRASA